jgi:nicotinamide-nucleotide amidase
MITWLSDKVKAMQYITAAERLGELLQAKRWLLATAESCTGGLVAATITDITGSSAWFERGFVTYSNLAKQEMLGVDSKLIAEYGAVSEPVAMAMAAGALTHSAANVSVAITGIAGPGGGSADKPVGTVWFAWQLKGHESQTSLQHFVGNRTLIRQQAANYCLVELIKYLGKIIR